MFISGGKVRLLMYQDKEKLQINNGMTDSPYTENKFQVIAPSIGATSDQLASQISDILDP